MYGTNSLSLSKILSGLSKGLGIVNQAIPIYKEVKPMVSNARKVLDVVKEINKPNKDTKVIDITPKKEVTEKVTPLKNNNTPVFFQ